MKLISWNVNGLRAVHKRGDLEWLFSQKADVICLQETKSRLDQLPEEVAKPLGYHAYYTWPTEKKGYSGVAILSKEKPEKVEFGMGLPEYDQEGRLIVAYFKDFVLLNCYFPNGGGGPDRLKYKLEFYDHFLAFINKLRKQGRKVVFCGDVNTAHEEIDLARPKENEENTGFLPEERAWLDEVVAGGYVDTFRHFYPHKTGAYSYWDMKTFARSRNVGWRIDYFFVSNDLLPKVKAASIASDVLGSDHCPTVLELK